MKKKEKIIQKFMNIILSTYTLIYVSPKIIIFLEIFFKNIFPNFSQVSEFQWDNGDVDVGVSAVHAAESEFQTRVSVDVLED